MTFKNLMLSMAPLAFFLAMLFILQYGVVGGLLYLLVTAGVICLVGVLIGIGQYLEFKFGDK